MMYCRDCCELCLYIGCCFVFRALSLSALFLFAKQPSSQVLACQEYSKKSPSWAWQVAASQQ